MLNIYPYKSRRRFQSTGRAGGINEEKTWTVKTEAVGKSQWKESPYLFANEWICANIAQFLRLPVPPFAMTSKKSRSTAMFISYSYDGDTKPDDVDPEQLYHNFPDECTGTVVFDILVANCDRSGSNLQVDSPSNPKSFYLIDHERALFYVHNHDGVEHLRSKENRLGVTDGNDSANEWHCLVELLDDLGSLQKWIERACSIPDWFIESVCEETYRLSLSRAECECAKEFLKSRRDTLGKLILNHKTRFPRIQSWPLFL